MRWHTLIKIIGFFFFLFSIHACGIWKKNPYSSDKNNKMLVNIRENIKKNAFNEPYLKAKIKVNYSSVERNIQLSGQIRMIKDSVIYISLTKFGFPVAKLRITPQQVEFYENINKTYFQGDLKNLSSMIGLDLEFDQFQNLITGDPLVYPDEKNWNITDVNENKITIEPVRKHHITKMILLPSLKTFETLMEYEGEKALLEYPEYLQENNIWFPKKIEIKNPAHQVEIRFNKLQTKEKPVIKFHIPESYTKMEVGK